MNAQKLEKWILLEQTGELSPRKKKRLEACPEALAKRDELKTLQASVPTIPEEASPWSAARIHARLQSERRSLFLPARIWAPVLGVASCLVLVFTTINFSTEPSEISVASVEAAVQDEWTMEFEEDLEELESRILAISDAPLNIMEM